jgi:hypothetical protein
MICSLTSTFGTLRPFAVGAKNLVSLGFSQIWDAPRPDGVAIPGPFFGGRVKIGWAVYIFYILRYTFTESRLHGYRVLPVPYIPQTSQVA